MTPKIGEPARPLRLRAAQGGEISLDDYRGRSPVVLWFTKGRTRTPCPW